jgi:hypothetical protein
MVRPFAEFLFVTPVILAFRINIGLQKPANTGPLLFAISFGGKISGVTNTPDGKVQRNCLTGRASYAVGRAGELVGTE